MLIITRQIGRQTWELSWYGIRFQLTSLQFSKLSTGIAVFPGTFVVRVLKVETADARILCWNPVSPWDGLDPKITTNWVFWEDVGRNAFWKLLLSISRPTSCKRHLNEQRFGYGKSCFDYLSKKIQRLLAHAPINFYALRIPEMSILMIQSRDI